MSRIALTDKDLALRCARGEADAWIPLVARLSSLVYGLTSRMLRNTLDTDDACREVFSRLYTSLSSYEADDPLNLWVARIAFDVCLERLRLTSAVSYERSEQAFRALATVQNERIPDLSADAEMLVDCSMGQFDAPDRAILHMYYRLRYTMTEICQATGLALAPLQSRLVRATNRLMHLADPTLQAA